jgi:hypothetical protein
MTEFNVWGTDKSLIGEDFCKECERECPGHYTNCPLYREHLSTYVNMRRILYPYAFKTTEDES